jgi:hypothetical protein
MDNKTARDDAAGQQNANKLRCGLVIAVPHGVKFHA